MASYFYVEKELDEWRPFQIGKATFIECAIWGKAVFGYDGPDYWHLDSLTLSTWNGVANVIDEMEIKSGPLFDMIETAFKTTYQDEINELVRNDWIAQSERIRTDVLLDAAE